MELRDATDRGDKTYHIRHTGQDHREHYRHRNTYRYDGGMNNMYNNLLTLKRIKGLTDDVKARIEKSWTWGLITDEEFKSLMEMDKGEAESL